MKRVVRVDTAAGGLLIRDSIICAVVSFSEIILFIRLIDD